MGTISRRLFSLFAFGTMAGGCFGSFRLTRAVYDFNSGMGGKFLQTVIFWVFVIVPVYEVAALIDVLIFNLIEFWGGSSNKHSETMPDGSQMELVRLSPDSVKLRLTSLGGRSNEFVFVRQGPDKGAIRTVAGLELRVV